MDSSIFLKRIQQSTSQLISRISKVLLQRKKNSLHSKFIHIKVQFQEKDFKELNVKKLQEILDMVSVN